MDKFIKKINSFKINSFKGYPTRIMPQAPRQARQRRHDLSIISMLYPGCEKAIGRITNNLSSFTSLANIYACIDGDVKVTLPSWMHCIKVPSGQCGIVRPTQYCVNLIKTNWILRLTWDAELIDKLDWIRDPRKIYGSMRTSGRRKSQIMRTLIKGTSIKLVNASYIDGFVILATREWWLNCYNKLPPTVNHYFDDSISSQIGLNFGWSLVNKQIALHRHREWRRIK